MRKTRTADAFHLLLAVGLGFVFVRTRRRDHRQLQSTAMAEENVLPIPNLALPQECFVLQQSSLSHLHDTARAALLRGIKADQMAPYYRLVVAANVLPLDQSLLDKLENDNATELERLDKVLKEAEETEGESDIADALRAKASYLSRIGEKVGANFCISKSASSLKYIMYRKKR